MSLMFDNSYECRGHLIISIILRHSYFCYSYLPLNFYLHKIDSNISRLQIQNKSIYSQWNRFTTNTCVQTGLCSRQDCNSSFVCSICFHDILTFLCESKSNSPSERTSKVDFDDLIGTKKKYFRMILQVPKFFYIYLLLTFANWFSFGFCGFAPWSN